VLGVLEDGIEPSTVGVNSISDSAIEDITNMAISEIQKAMKKLKLEDGDPLDADSGSEMGDLDDGAIDGETEALEMFGVDAAEMSAEDLIAFGLLALF